MNERLYCCVDGGASNTRVALFDDSEHRLGLTVTGPTSLTVRGTEAWAEILGALENLARAVALDSDYLSHIHFGIGLAGAHNNAQRQKFLDAAPAAAALRVSTDAYIATLGAHGGAPGAVIIVGTGSVGYRIEAAGRCRIVGGWGFPIGDEGSGAWIGRQAVTQVAQIVDTRFRKRATEMHRAVMERTGQSRDALLDWLLSAPPAQFAELAQLVVEHAGWGDTAALEIVSEAGREIDTLAEALDSGRKIPLALVGGLAEPLDAFLPDRLRTWARPPQEGPVSGALLLAQGRAPDETIMWQNR
jgi:glucosamine kinase